MNGQFKDYVEFDPGDEPRPKKVAPVLEPGTVIEKPCFVTDMDGDCWWIDPAAKLVQRCNSPDDN